MQKKRKNLCPKWKPLPYLKRISKPSLPLTQIRWQKAGNHEKNYRLKEVTIKAKKRTKEKEIYESRSKSIAYYDVHSELDDIKDSGKFIGDDIHELMMNMNKNFSPVSRTKLSVL